jgi:hypothetical protein
LRLPFSLPPTTHRVTVEVFDPASTRVTELTAPSILVILVTFGKDHTENTVVLLL